MRHGNKINNLSRKSGHRKAMLSNMACSLIEHKRITTTLAKAKSLRVYVEPLLTKSKNDNTHSRRVVFSYLQNKNIVSELFREVAPKISDRNGGYTRIIRTGNRLGDNAEMCLIELVDFNEIYTKEVVTKTKKRSRRGGKGGKKNDESVSQEETVVDAEVTDESPVVDAEVVEETTVSEDNSNVEVSEEVKDETVENTASEDTKDDVSKESEKSSDESENSSEEESKE